MTWVVKSEGAYLRSMKSALAGAGTSEDGLCERCGQPLGYTLKQRKAKKFESLEAARTAAKKVPHAKVVRLVPKDEPTLAKLHKDVEPNNATLTKTSAFCDLLGLVCEEYILRDLVEKLSKEERYEIAKWASVCHVAAGCDDPPLGRPKPPEALSKVLLMPGRRVTLARLGAGIVEDYDWPDHTGGDASMYGMKKHPKVKLDNGWGYAYPLLKEVISVE